MEDIIDPPLEVSVMPLYLFIFLLVVAFVGLFFFVKMKKKASKNSKLASLEELDFRLPSKELAYRFTIYAKELNAPCLQEELKAILEELAHYKYQKTTQELPQELKEAMQRYIQKVQKCF